MKNTKIKKTPRSEHLTPRGPPRGRSARRTNRSTRRTSNRLGQLCSPLYATRAPIRRARGKCLSAAAGPHPTDRTGPDHEPTTQRRSSRGPSVPGPASHAAPVSLSDPLGPADPSRETLSTSPRPLSSLLPPLIIATTTAPRRHPSQAKPPRVQRPRPQPQHPTHAAVGFAREVSRSRSRLLVEEED